MFVLWKSESKMCCKNVEVINNLFLLRMRTVPRLVVGGVRNLVTHVSQTVFSNVPRTRVLGLAPSPVSFHVGSVGSRSSVRRNVN